MPNLTQYPRQYWVNNFYATTQWERSKTKSCFDLRFTGPNSEVRIIRPGEVNDAKTIRANLKKPHRKTCNGVSGRRSGLLRYGNGCKHNADCFTCPLPDCVFALGHRGNGLKFFRITPKPIEVINNGRR